MDKASGRLDVGCALCITKAALCKKMAADEESSRFLKKAAQKLLFMLGHGLCRRQSPWPSITKFFCFFLFTKRSLPFTL
jgi:hypothetical protein